MRRVITASLNGNAYQIEDDAYAVLAAYLEDATRALAGNPDKDEIIADVEQAIADKCARYLSSHKSVIARSEIDQVLAEMGPVDGGDNAAGATAGGTGPGPGAGTGPATGAPAGAAAADAGTPRRLYQISDGALISGVCNGIAAYFHIDVTVVRVAFVVLLFLTGGTVGFVYLVLMFVLPYAKTSEEHAEAHGIPFNARTLVESAKQKAAEFTHGNTWRESRAEWRRTRALWRAERRRARAERLAERYARPVPSSAPPRVPYAAHVLSGLVVTILSLVLAAFTIAWVVAIISLATTGALFGWFLPHGIPFWVGILLLCVLYSMIAWPIKAIRHASYHVEGPYHPPRGPFDGFVGFVIVVLLLWYGYHHVPELRDFFDHIRHFWNQTVDV